MKSMLTQTSCEFSPLSEGTEYETRIKSTFVPNRGGPRYISVSRGQGDKYTSVDLSFKDCEQFDVFLSDLVKFSKDWPYGPYVYKEDE